MIKIVELASVAPQPWRNGGGQTRELLAWPAGAEWQLRVSVADIDRDGPFSAFPGVARCFTVLEGAGVVLSFKGQQHTLTTADAPLAFDGADAPGCRLIAGPTRDLNLMARASAGALHLRAAGPGAAPAPRVSMRWRGLYTATAARLVIGSAEALDLAAGSLAWTDTPALLAAAWHLHNLGPQPMRAWAMALAAPETPA